MFQMLSFPWTRGGAGTRRTLVCTWLAAAGRLGRRAREGHVPTLNL